MKKSVGMTKIDLLNAKNDSVALKDLADTIKVTGLSIDESIDTETGEIQEVSYLVADNDYVYGSTSKTVRNSVCDIIEYIESEELSLPLSIRVVHRTSNSGREFLTLKIL